MVARRWQNDSSHFNTAEVGVAVRRLFTFSKNTTKKSKFILLLFLLTTCSSIWNNNSNFNLVRPSVVLINGTDFSHDHDQEKYPSYQKTITTARRPVLIFAVGNGLHNQLMSFIDAMVVATLFQKHYDVVLPTMWGSMGKSSENRSEPMKFGDLYDETHFIQCFSQYAMELHIYKDVPPRYTVQNIVYQPAHVGRKINDNNNWNATVKALLEYAQRSNTAVDLGRFYARWNYDLFDSQSFDSRRNVIQCLKPAPKIHKVVTKAVENMRHFSSSTMPKMMVTAIHPRLESDWKAHCEKHSSLRDCWIDEEEWLSRLLAAPVDMKEKKISISDSTPASSSWSQKILLLLGNGAYINRTMFDMYNFTTITKADLIPPQELSVFQHQSSLAAIDFFLGLEADMFYGFMLSSMDVIIYETRMYKCLPTRAIHFHSGLSNWLELVSRWTRSFFFYRLDDIICHYLLNSNSAVVCEKDPVEMSSHVLNNKRCHAFSVLKQ